MGDGRWRFVSLKECFGGAGVAPQGASRVSGSAYESQ